MTEKLQASIAVIGSGARRAVLTGVRLASVTRNLLIAAGLGIGAQNVWPDTALLVASGALFLLTTIDRIRRGA